MKNIFLSTLFIVVSLLIVGSQYFVSLENKTTKEKDILLSGYDNAVWDWNPLEKPNLSEFLDNLKSRGITTVYLNISDYVDLYEITDKEERLKKIENFNTGMKNYTTLVRDKGLIVHALVGGANWGNASHRYLNGIILNYVKEFNLLNPDINFQGIQFDIEPYSQESFNVQKSHDIFVQYLDTIDEIVTNFNNLQKQSEQLSLIRLGLVIPYWYDGQDEHIQKITWKGENKYIFYHLLNCLNQTQNGYVVIMAYRNFVDGSDGVIEHIQDEINFSNQYTQRLKIIIGQETSNVKPKKITYFGKSFNDMLKEIKKIGLNFEGYTNIGGFAFNNADSFLELK